MTRERLHAVILWTWVLLKVSEIHGATFSVSSNATDGILPEGQNLKLNCIVTGKSGFAVNWRGGQESIPSRTQNCLSTNPVKYIISECNGTTIFNIVIKNISHSEDRGNWRCVNGGDESRPLNIQVLVPSRKPVIAGYNGNEILTHGRNANLTCESSCSYPNTTLNWISSETVDQQNIREEISYCRDELYKTTSVLFVPGKETSSGKAYYTCTASSSEPSIPPLNETVLVMFKTKESPPTTTGMTEVISTTVPPDNKPALVAALVTLIIISLIGSCSVCIFVCIKYPDKASSLKCIVDCICITVVFLCVILGNICGGVLWRTVDPNQDVGIIVLVIILSDLGFFILGIVVGMIKDWKEQTQDKDKVLRDILVKLPNIVLSVATFGGVSAGIAIAFSCKNGKTRRASITPEETQTCPRRENSANSKDSAASQSGVPLHEGIGHNTREESDTIPMQKVKKKKKKKPEKRSKEPYIQKVPSPRKLPPLKT